jgi:hypothetical protein
MKYLSFVLILVLSDLSYGDPATTDSHWQWNRNVTIEKIYAYWDTSTTRLLLDNGEVCYILKEDEQLFSVALSMHAQKAKGEVICQLANSTLFEGKTARRAHRIMVN